MAQTRSETLLPCTPCDADTWFEAVVFDDGLGDETELACVECGHAVYVGVALDAAPAVVVVGLAAA